MRVRVVCGLSDTMAIFVPMTRLRRVDLPAFGRPMMDTKPARTIWNSLAGVDLNGLRLAEAHLVDAPALGFEHFDVHAIELERLPNRRYAADP